MKLFFQFLLALCVIAACDAVAQARGCRGLFRGHRTKHHVVQPSAPRGGGCGGVCN